MKDPQGLQEYIGAVLRMESNVFCRVVSNTEAPGQCLFHRQQPLIRQPAAPNTVRLQDRPWVQQVMAQDAPQCVSQRPRQQLSDVELDRLHHKKLCFKCKSPWSRSHQCSYKELRVLTVINGLVMEVFEPWHDLDEDTVLPQQNEQLLMTLSLNAFLGIDSPKTTKFCGSINNKEVIVMLDSGASHNVISPEIVKRLRLKLCDESSLEVLLGNGVTVKAMGVCRSVPFTLNHIDFTSDFTSLELGSVDVILGIQWLETLGCCEVDWKRQELSFSYRGDRVTLLDDPTLHRTRLSLKALNPISDTSQFGGEVLLTTAAATSSKPEYPPVAFYGLDSVPKGV